MSLFITLEGPEGSGKSSAMRLVYERLQREGYPIVVTREPGGTPISEKIRDILLDKKNVSMDIRTEALLFAASRRQHLIEKVWPALQKGNLVFCDRFLDSSLSYQGYARGLGIEEVLEINLFATQDTFPDLTLLFDIDPEIGLARIASDCSREVNRLDEETLSFHRKVREGYLLLAEKYPQRIVTIDASRPLEEVAEQTYRIIKERL